MKKLILKGFEQLKIEKKQALDCFDMPLAYATTVYSDDNYFSYFLLTLLYHCWNGNNDTIMRSKKQALNYLGLNLESKRVATKKEFLEKVYMSIDSGTPIFVILDYFNIFYEPTFYHRRHIAHGAVITGYEEDRGRLILQENAHMDFVGMYQLYLTDDMVYDMWKKSAVYFNDGDESAPGSLYIVSNFSKNSVSRSLIEIFEFFISEILKRKNTLLTMLESNEFSFLFDTTAQTTFRKHQYTSMEVLFDIIGLLISRNQLDEAFSEYLELREEYLRQRNIIVLSIIKSAITTSALHTEILHQYIDATIKLDDKLVKFSKKLIFQINNLKDKRHMVDFALNCKVTASSETAYAGLPAVAANAVNGNVGAELGGNVWRSNETDLFHWMQLDLEKIVKIQKIMLRFVRNYCLKYEIQASCDCTVWETIVSEENNTSEVAQYDVGGVMCRYIRLKIDIPVLYGSVAMLHEVEAWGWENDR